MKREPSRSEQAMWVGLKLAATAALVSVTAAVGSVKLPVRHPFIEPALHLWGTNFRALLALEMVTFALAFAFVLVVPPPPRARLAEALIQGTAAAGIVAVLFAMACLCFSAQSSATDEVSAIRSLELWAERAAIFAVLELAVFGVVFALAWRDPNSDPGDPRGDRAA